MKVLICDDEPLARARLRTLLKEIPGVEVAGEAGDGKAALLAWDRLRPEVVLLDIRMPGMDGLEAAAQLALEAQPPAVIFTTAYGDHALAAFEAQAVDYLLKPVRRERLAQALARVARLGEGQRLALREAGGDRPRSHISARYRETLQVVAVEDILYLRADHKYVCVRHREGELLIEESLKSLEQEFGGRFLRVHRNALVALEHVAALERTPEGRHRLRLKGCQEGLEVSRRQLGEVRRLLRSRRMSA
ncbi:MAG TPA: response regulator transcription factor [Gammaproteobacteria bacterium]|nr:response regulator transcription factor [Gammaproteobacteria bacterium]